MKFKALNQLGMSTAEAAGLGLTLGVDFTDNLPVGSRIIGLNSITVTPAGGPDISEGRIGTDAKSVQFRARGDEVTPRTYEVKILVTVKRGSIEDTVEAVCELVVRS